MNKKYLCVAYFLLVITSPNTLLCGQTDSSSTIFHKTAISLWINRFQFDGGLGLRLWIDENYSIDGVINGYYIIETRYTDGGITPEEYRDIQFSPYISVKRHIFVRPNVTPYIGYKIKFVWDLGDYRRSTHMVSGILFGVESWITDSITLSGQHAFLTSRYLNSNSKWYYGYGESTIALSIYF